MQRRERDGPDLRSILFERERKEKGKERNPVGALTRDKAGRDFEGSGKSFLECVSRRVAAIESNRIVYR